MKYWPPEEDWKRNEFAEERRQPRVPLAVYRAIAQEEVRRKKSVSNIEALEILLRLSTRTAEHFGYMV